METQKAQLGDIVKDKFTGFEGTAMGRCEYLTGCEQILVVPLSLDEKGNPRENKWFDIDRLEVVEAGKFAKHEITSNGGFSDDEPDTK